MKEKAKIFKNQICTQNQKNAYSFGILLKLYDAFNIFRFRKDEQAFKVNGINSSNLSTISIKKLFNLENQKEPCEFSGGVAKWGIVVFCKSAKIYKFAKFNGSFHVLILIF